MNKRNGKTAMVIAYHFPPVAVSSGVHRMLSLANALVEDGWSVTVLSAHARTYERVDPDTMNRVDTKIRIRRAQAFDTARHLSVRGKYWQMMALPDNYQSWVLFGVMRGLWDIYTYRPNLMISTYPVASAHMIAIILNRLTGIPWVADFRDPMAQAGYPADPRKWRVFKWIEKSAAKRASRLVFTTPGALAEYQDRYPSVPADRWQLVTNGYDEEQFSGIKPREKSDDQLRILHSGLIYIHERNPKAFFEALSQLKKDGSLKSSGVLFVLRASGHEKTYEKWVNQLEIADLVDLVPALPYREALQEMLEADGLLLLQGEGCNQQIPAKAYEYIRAGKPILALTDGNGDTAKLLTSVAEVSVAPLDDRDTIADAILTFLARINGGPQEEVQSPATVSAYERKSLSREWVKSLNTLCNQTLTCVTDN